MSPITKARLFRDAAETKRYHTRRVLRQQTVGAHTFGMLLLLRQIAPDVRPEVIWACVHHDLPEHFTGDIPAPIKRASPELSVLLEGLESDLAPLHYAPDLTPEEWALVKWVDLMELTLFCLEERDLGNRTDGMTEIIVNGIHWLMDMKEPNDTAYALLAQVHTSAYQLGVPVKHFHMNRMVNLSGEQRE